MKNLTNKQRKNGISKGEAVIRITVVEQRHLNRRDEEGYYRRPTVHVSIKHRKPKHKKREED